MIKGDMPQERELVKYTIILNKPIPKKEVMHRRYFIDGKPLNTERSHDLLRQAGHKIEVKDIPCMMLPTVFNGIPIKCKDGGLMVYPLNKLNFDNLKKELIQEDLFYHSCYLPNMEKLK